MPEQKYRIGDRVCIRPFAKIDTADIGNVEYRTDDERTMRCYGISARYINERSTSPKPVYVSHVEQRRETYIYDLSPDPDGRFADDYHWAQGMIMPFYEEDVFIPTDKDEIFETMFS